MYKTIEPLIAGIGFLSLLFLYLSGVGYQSGVYTLQEAFTVMRWSASGGITATTLVIFYILWQRPMGVRLGVLFVSAILGLMAFYMPYRQQVLAGTVPPIHDISTDTIDPPAFVAVVPLRAAYPNPAEYDGEETASQQREAYPDIMTMIYAQDSQSVFEAVANVVQAMGWELVDANSGEGRIEAVDTTRWFGFKDDVVIRLRPGTGNSTIVDIRSKSRVGRSDIGMNARRIRSFRDALNDEIGG